jgi:hypothetical protein
MIQTAQSVCCCKQLLFLSDGDVWHSCFVEVRAPQLVARAQALVQSEQRRAEHSLPLRAAAGYVHAHERAALHAELRAAHTRVQPVKKGYDSAYCAISLCVHVRRERESIRPPAADEENVRCAYEAHQTEHASTARTLRACHQSRRERLHVSTAHQ